MPSRFTIDDRLVREAMRLGGHKTKEEAVNAALREYIQRHRQHPIFDLMGKIDYYPDYDYKAERWRGRKRLTCCTHRSD